MNKPQETQTAKKKTPKNLQTNKLGMVVRVDYKEN